MTFGNSAIVSTNLDTHGAECITPNPAPVPLCCKLPNFGHLMAYSGISPFHSPKYTTAASAIKYGR